MDALIKQRGGYKATITRIDNWLIKNTDVVHDISQYKSRKEVLMNAFNQYTNIQDNVETLDNGQISDREMVEDQFYNTLAKLTSKIEFLSVNTIPNLSNQTKPIIIHSSSNSPKVNLPELNVPLFNGQISEWTSFYEIFDTLITNNPDLNNIQKLIYLKSYLRQEPLDLINNLQIISDNFNVAIDILKNRYENKFLIINTHLKALMELPSLTKCTSNTLREFLTKIKQNMESLKNLKLPVEHWDILLIYIFSAKLDFNTKKSFEMEKNPNHIPTLKEFLDFLEKRCLVLENLSHTTGFTSGSTYSPNNKPKTSSRTLSYHSNANHSNLATNNNNIKCSFCDKLGHKIYKCSTFQNLPLSQKHTFIKNKKMCLNCLGFHNTNNCFSLQRCTVCTKKHNTLLHSEQSENLTQENINQSQNKNGQSNFQQNNSHFSGSNPPSHEHFETIIADHITTDIQELKISEDSITCSAFSGRTEVLLATAIVKLYTIHNKPVFVKAILDCGSQTSFIKEDLVKTLGYETYTKKLQISGISNSSALSNKMLDIKIHSTSQPNTIYPVSCAVLPNITCNLPQIPIDFNSITIPDNITLADSSFCTPSQISLLLGADVYYDLISDGLIKLGKNLPVLQNTSLGWIVAGNIPNPNSTHLKSTFDNSSKINHQNDVSLFIQTSDLDSLIQKFWTIEEIPQKPILTAEDQRAEEIFLDSTKRLPNGSFQVNLPLKTSEEHLKLGNSFTTSSKRFFTLEKRLKKDAALFKLYRQFIEEYISLGHAQYVPLNLKNEKLENKYFLPHHCVLRESSATTKLRVVFDGSMKSSTGISLNDTLLKGFPVQPELFDILCRFRSYKFVIICDIEKMFRQIRISPDQTFLLNILWRNDQSEDLKCIELLTVTYGTNCAPYLSTRCLVELAKSGKEKYPLASEAILCQCYVDDILYGCDSPQILYEIYTQLTELFKTANIRLHKWSSNSTEFLKKISFSHNETDYDIKPDNSLNKVLGLSWNSSSDIFSISVPQIINKESFSKREVLSIIAQMFDPLGLIGPVIVSAKIFMQKLWLSKINWDECLSNELLIEWNQFLKSIQDLIHLKIPRYLFLNKDIFKIEIHGFSDSSLKAYGACVYFRTIYTDNTVSSNLIVSKSRVSPLKTTTLPRLELCGALLLAKLINRVLELFKNKIQISSVNLWTDSQIVLCWLKSHPSRWTIFISNRVSEIQQITHDFNWRHIRSRDNPADILSRGATAHEVSNSKLWWYGPSFFQNIELNLHKNDIQVTIDDIPEERKSVLHINKLDNINEQVYDEILCKFSSYSKLHRVLAFSLRFINNCKSPRNKLSGPLTISELDTSQRVIIKILQQKYFHDEINTLKHNKIISNKAILSLNPFIDFDGILRVGGRLAQANISYEQKHPILLPAKDYIVRLLIKKEHLRLLHVGAQTLLHNLRLRFWPMDGLRETKRIIRNCVTCFRFKSQAANQLMADLPKDRISISRPFQKVGIDFGGPFSIKTSNLRKAPLVKAYMSIFVCMVTKAVHLELVSSLSTDSFLLTLKRFIARRGNPTTIYSDNATNFLGSSNKLRELNEFFKNKQNSATIQSFLSLNEIQWKFIPPRSPHWGGLWEASIKSAKHHIYRIVGNATLTFEEFSSVLAQIEAIMNSRPLCGLSNDPSDLTCLTPGHFLIGTNLTSYPEKNISDVQENRLNCWQRCVKIQQTFWKRWSAEYLNRLQNRPKWLQPSKNLEVNDIVLLKEENLSPLQWSLGRIIQIIPGADNKVRVVKVKTKEGIFMRAISKICPLPNINE